MPPKNEPETNAPPAPPAPDNKPLFSPDQPQGDPPPAGGTELEFISDYWPKDQPEPQADPRKPHIENRIRAGERRSVPAEEAMDLLERGVAKRVRE